uniref:Uncharacterized protein n=1 Tax=Eutreptiella gymnastica TaxID=73025 RepID=A0A7S4FVK2_9EUGL
MPSWNPPPPPEGRVEGRRGILIGGRSPSPHCTSHAMTSVPGESMGSAAQEAIGLQFRKDKGDRRIAGIRDHVLPAWVIMGSCSSCGAYSTKSRALGHRCKALRKMEALIPQTRALLLRALKNDAPLRRCDDA